MNNRKGIVYLIGAGPGDPRLITMRGIECLEQADVVVYDRLVNPRLLSFAPPQSEKLYVGKGANCHALSQPEINRLLVEKAREGRTVARLKGGDPFVFGRGGEEAETLQEEGILFEVVPGITSAIAVPAYAGIPVTHRQHNSAFTVVTGHEDPFKKDSNIAWDHLAGMGGTLVFLMGLENLPEITRRLIQEGRPSDTPVALIRWGTFAEQQVVTGDLGSIIDRSREAGLKPPVVTVVGEVVKLREKLQWLERKPLFGRRILVTRSREQASVLSRRLEFLGAEVWEYPTIEIAPCHDFTNLDRAIEGVAYYHWIIFTSVNGVNAFFQRLWGKGKDVRQLIGAKIVAIGPGTNHSLAVRGIRAEYVPPEFRAEAIVEGLRGRMKPGERVLLPRAREARLVLPQSLKEMGLLVDEVTAYETLTAEGDSESLRRMLREHSLDAVTFTSSSTVKNFVNLLGRPEDNPGMGRTVMACIGPITADTAEKLGLKVDVVAREYTIEGLVDALTQFFTPKEEERGER